MLIPGSKARKSSNQASGTGFVDFWSHGQKVIKSSLLGLVLSTSGDKAGKSLNRVSWDSFCRLLQPRPESHQIEFRGLRFVLSAHDTARMYIGRTFQYRIIAHWVTSWSPLRGSPVYSPSQRGIHDKYVSAQKCFHHNWSAAAVTAQKSRCLQKRYSTKCNV